MAQQKTKAVAGQNSLTAIRMAGLGNNLTDQMVDEKDNFMRVGGAIQEEMVSLDRVLAVSAGVVDQNANLSAEGRQIEKRAIAEAVLTKMDEVVRAPTFRGVANQPFEQLRHELKQRAAKVTDEDRARAREIRERVPADEVRKTLENAVALKRPETIEALIDDPMSALTDDQLSSYRDVLEEIRFPELVAEIKRREFAVATLEATHRSIDSGIREQFNLPPRPSELESTADEG
jgi:hypothetical protein